MDAITLENVYQFFRRTIAAGETAKINAWGNYVTLLSNSGSNNIFISIGGQPMQEMPFGLSVALPHDARFKYLEFYNSAGVSVTIEFTVSAGLVSDNRSVINSTLVVDPSSDGLATPAAITVNTAAPGAATIAADSTRREVIIQNNGANPIWAGDANVDGANNRGILIPIGQAIVLSTQAAIYLRSTGGASTASTMNLTR